MTTFNPTMVWFYHEYNRRESIEQLLMQTFFQSHYGLILSSKLCQRRSSEVQFCTRRFQSHYGLILSYTCCCTRRNGGEMLSIPLWSDFISKHNIVNRQQRSIFQSHYGLILSKCKCLGSLFKGRPFNPTMVWFYLYINATDEISWTDLSIPLWSDFISCVFSW